jgi:hypothetical protein
MPLLVIHQFVRQLAPRRRRADLRVVAAQVDPFESKGLKLDFHFIGSRVETRRFKLLNSHLCSPHRVVHVPRQEDGAAPTTLHQLLDVAAQVEFEAANFETSFSFEVSRLRHFSLEHRFKG